MNNLMAVYIWLINKNYPTNEDTLQLAKIMSGQKNNLQNY